MHSGFDRGFWGSTGKMNTNGLRTSRTRNLRGLGLGLVLVLCVVGVLLFGDRAPVSTESPEGQAFESLPAAIQDQLTALGYVITSDSQSKEQGVTILDPRRASKGWSLYVSMLSQEAVLIDELGRTLHRWKAPEASGQSAGSEKTMPQWFRTVRLFRNGDILAQTDFGPLMRLDKESNVLWKSEGIKSHHDVDVSDEGEIFALASSGHTYSRELGGMVSPDWIVKVSPSGQERRRVSFLQALSRGGFDQVVDEFKLYQQEMKGLKKFDITHLNTIEILGESVPGLPQAFRPGNLLLSSPTINRLFILDFDIGKVVWTQKGTFRYQHHPTLLANGRILLFDNRGAGDDRSRILEIDPATGADLWRFGMGSAASFQSRCCGRVHPLPNGNMLVVVSMEGHAFEVTRDREVVWEFTIQERLLGKMPILNDLMRIDPTHLDASFISEVALSEVR